MQRWVLAALRKRQFFSLAELNEAIGELTGKLNQRPFRKLPGTRARVFIKARSAGAAAAAGTALCVRASGRRHASDLDYHVELEGHHYSTPYQLVGKEVEIRYTATTVEILYQGKRVASHARSSEVPGTHTTISEHRPKVASAIPGMDAHPDVGMGRARSGRSRHAW